MGFPSVCYTVILPRPVALVVQLLDLLKLALSAGLFFLGLPSSPPYSAAVDDLYPFPTYPLLHLSDSHLPPPASVKSRLPVVRFSALRSDGSALCAVCLGALHPSHEVRHLGNCLHAFHKSCIDKWVDVGQLTCPLCRAPLLHHQPPEDDDENGGRKQDHSKTRPRRLTKEDTVCLQKPCQRGISSIKWFHMPICYTKVSHRPACLVTRRKKSE
ncbi:brassinosteroid-responsive RING protein 1-like isoform X1 [Zingiber officinale]|uniref:brassinosteroid-responsive RING protein 1-like isoform X1 n=1 Tax=Zingiber officinale TaxID=94328 RepID=UPI001C4D6920|nr:brassinosteroid-responsive RING protein 1-like isoform X1 [Zingiber officinale]